MAPQGASTREQPAGPPGDTVSAGLARQASDGAAPAGCGYADIERINRQRLLEPLQELAGTQYFRYFKVNMDSDCLEWDAEGKGQYAISPDEIPAAWREKEDAAPPPEPPGAKTRRHSSSAYLRRGSANGAGNGATAKDDRRGVHPDPGIGAGIPFGAPAGSDRRRRAARPDGDEFNLDIEAARQGDSAARPDAPPDGRKGTNGGKGVAGSPSGGKKAQENANHDAENGAHDEHGAGEPSAGVADQPDDGGWWEWVGDSDSDSDDGSDSDSASSSGSSSADPYAQETEEEVRDLAWEVDRVDADQVPQLMHAKGWTGYDNPWTPDDDSSVQYIYVDLVANPERHTGYRGERARRVWQRLYAEPCFAALDSPECPRENRILFRLLSGMHTSVTVHIAKDYLLDQTTCQRGPNVRVFEKRLSKRHHRCRMQNLYFAYLFVARAVARAAPVLLASDFDTGAPDEAQHTRGAIERLLKKEGGCIAALGACLALGEDQLWSDARGLERRAALQGHFRSIMRLLDCVTCNKCKLWGKLQVLGLASAMKILLCAAADGEDHVCLERNEAIALLMLFRNLASSIETVRTMACQMVAKRRWQRAGGAAALLAGAGPECAAKLTGKGAHKEAADGQQENGAQGGVANGMLGAAVSAVRGAAVAAAGLVCSLPPAAAAAPYDADEISHPPVAAAEANGSEPADLAGQSGSQGADGVSTAAAAAAVTSGNGGGKGPGAAQLPAGDPDAVACARLLGQQQLDGTCAPSAIAGADGITNGGASAKAGTTAKTAAENGHAGRDTDDNGDKYGCIEELMGRGLEHSLADLRAPRRRQPRRRSRRLSGEAGHTVSTP